MTQKSILEQALLQVNTLEEAVRQNAKGILSSVMKKELSELLKESDEMEEEELETPEEETEDMSEQPMGDDADDEEMPSMNDEPSKGIDDMDSEMEDEDDSDMEDEDDSEMEDEDDSDMEDKFDPGFGDSDDMLDMTGASDEEVLKVFKAMSDEDGIVVKKDGENIELQDGEDEYIIKLNESEEDELSEEEDELSEEDEYDELSEEDEETVYEIELDDEDDFEMKHASKMAPKKTSKEEDMGESARTKAFGQKGGLASKKIFKAGRKDEINEQFQTLKKQNQEYKKALILFKDKLNEVAVFNANLAHATRLFTEHTTTKQEKMTILKRFDSVSTINESKNLFKSIRTELDNKKPVTESVTQKLSSTPSTSSSKEVLSESKAYENPQFKRMKDLMSKIK
jgi:hypothetical protein